MVCLCADAAATGSRCTYEYTVWNVKEKRSIKKVRVDKPYGELEPREKSREGCTPCEEDQETIVLSSGLKFRACRVMASRLKGAMELALAKGQAIKTVVGYRAQMSRGQVDRDGNRTELSNHAFGVAVDINEEFNGLYSNCPHWSPTCELTKGGAYSPGKPLSLVAESPIVVALGKAGFRWGGEIAGRQKDFMHFSPSGY
jgi:hypothetical protein